MATFIATYDLNKMYNPHQCFMDAAIKLGWSPWIKGSDNRWHKLPNTTISGEFSSQDAAVKAFQAIEPAAEKELKQPITVEKWIVAQYSMGSFISDDVTS